MLWQLFRGLFINPFVYIVTQVVMGFCGLVMLILMVTVIAVPMYVCFSAWGWEHGLSLVFAVVVAFFGACVWVDAINRMPQHRKIRGRSSSWFTKKGSS